MLIQSPSMMFLLPNSGNGFVVEHLCNVHTMDAYGLPCMVLLRKPSYALLQTPENGVY
jgi:hypothetical protein